MFIDCSIYFEQYFQQISHFHFQISLLDALINVRDILNKQEVKDIKNDKEMDNDVIGVALKIKYSPTSLSSSTKPKRATASNKVSPKPKLAQEKESVHWDYSKDSALKKKKKSTKYDTKCPFAANHKKEELTGLLEEQIVGNLDSGYLLGAKCSASEKVIAHKQI